MRDRFLPAVIAAALVLSACGEMRRDFLPRTHTTSISPDGRRTAWVRQGFSIDPPDDHIFLQDPNGRVTKLIDLAPDADWCRTVIWTADSARVGFLITDNRLSVFDASSHEHVSEVVLVKIDGYPGSEAARNVTFTDSGQAVTFERIDRATERLLSRETHRLPTVRRRVRLLWSDTGTASGPTWVKLVAGSGHEIRVPVTPGPDGLAVLPAFDDGPLRVVEFGAYRSGTTVVLRDVPATDAPLVVRFRRP